MPLLGADPTMPGQRQILGIPLLTSPYVTTTNNVVWGIPQAYGYFVLRQNAQGSRPLGVLHIRPGRYPRHSARRLRLPNPAAIAKIATT